MIVYRAPAKPRPKLTPKQEKKREERVWKEILKKHRCNVPNGYEVHPYPTKGTIWWCDYCDSYWKWTGDFVPAVWRYGRKMGGWKMMRKRSALNKINRKERAK